VIASANAWIAHHGVRVDGLFPHLRDAREFQYMVSYANDTLNIEGARYARSGYNSTHERFREIISRFAEFKQVEYKSSPELLHFLAPGIDTIWEKHYIPHLHRMVARLDTYSAKTSPSPSPSQRPLRRTMCLQPMQ